MIFLFFLPLAAVCPVQEMRNNSKIRFLAYKVPKPEAKSQIKVGKYTARATQSVLWFIYMQQTPGTASAHWRAQVQQQKNSPAQSNVSTRVANKGPALESCSPGSSQHTASARPGCPRTATTTKSALGARPGSHKHARKWFFSHSLTIFSIFLLKRYLLWGLLLWVVSNFSHFWWSPLQKKCC